MQRFFVLNENMLCAAEGLPEFTVCSQTPLTTCLMTVLAVKSGSELVVGQETHPTPEGTIRLAACEDIYSFGVPECHHAAIVQQEMETALSKDDAKALLGVLSQQCIDVLNGYLKSRGCVDDLIICSEETTTSFQNVYDSVAWVLPILNDDLLTNNEQRLAVVIKGIRELLTIPMEKGMPEPIAEIEALRNTLPDVNPMLFHDALLAYDGIRKAHQLALDMQRLCSDAMKRRDWLVGVVNQGQRLSYDINLMVARLKATDPTFSKDVQIFGQWKATGDLSTLQTLSELLNQGIEYHNDQRQFLITRKYPEYLIQ